MIREMQLIGLMAAACMSGAIPSGHAWATTPLPPEREAEVRALVEEAQGHRAAGRFEAAIASLHRALALHSAPWLLFNLGRVHEVAAQHDLARRYFELAATAEHDAETRRKALEGVRRVDDLGPRGVLRLRVLIDPDGALADEGAEVTGLRVDGYAWEPRLGRSLNLSRGPHVIELSRAGFAPWKQAVEVGELSLLDARLSTVGAAEPEAAETEPEVAAPVNASPAPTTPAATAEVGAADGAGWWPWAIAGVGLAGAAVGGGYLVSAEQDWERVREAPSDAMFQDEARALVASGQTKRTLGLWLVGVGASVGVGALTWALASDAEGAIVVTPLVGPSVGAGLVGRF
jgi:hypothetical protein